MDIIKILLITLLAAVGGGCIIGIVSGKHAVKKAMSGSKPLLSKKELAIYLGLFLAGAACIAFGVLWLPNTGQDMMGSGEMDGMYEDGMMENPTTESGEVAVNEFASDDAQLDGDGQTEEAADGAAGDETADGQAADENGEEAAQAGEADAKEEPAASQSTTATSNRSGTVRRGTRVGGGGGTVVVYG